MSNIKTYSDFQALSKSEKIGLVQLEASKRLMGWVVHSGSVYKLTGFDYAVVASIADSGTALTAVSSVAAVTAGKYFNDRANKVLYLRTSDSVNPNGKFLAMIFRMFFANVPVTAPNDLASGTEVAWLPLLKATSQFGMTLDTQYQLGEAIDGSGSITFENDQAFWKPIFDKVYFENQRISIYSWNRDLPISEIKLIYRGRIYGKTYAFDSVTFQVKDALNELNVPMPLSDLSTVAGARIPTALQAAKKRQIYGYVYGLRPTNIDQILSGYPLTGTFAATFGSQNMVGTGTSFLSQLSPDDQIFLGGSATAYTVQSVTDNTHAVLTEAFSSADQSGVSAVVKPASPRRWMNRKFQIAGHALCEPTTTVVSAKTTTQLIVGSTAGFLPGDPILVAGVASQVKRAWNGILQLSIALPTLPSAGDTVKRLAVSNVYLNDRLLTYSRDYIYDATAGQLTLDSLAEFNVAPVLSISGTVTFSSGSRAVTGSGTIFSKQVKSGDWIKANTQGTYYEVLSVENDTGLTLRTAAGYNAATGALIRSVEVYDEDSVVLSIDVVGVSVDGTVSGTLLSRGPEIVNDILSRCGIGSLVDATSFATANQLAPQRIGLAIPSKYADTTAATAKDVINQINQSIFGALVQNADFLLQYVVFSPNRPSSTIALRESDILNLAIESRSDNIAKTSKVKYLFKEYDVLSKAESNLLASTTSPNAQYLAGSTNVKEFATLLVDSNDAQILANRWAFVLEVSSSLIKLDTKLQLARASVTDPVLIVHEKLYYRIGSASSRKVASVQSAMKTIADSHVDLEDLANAFSRCACIAPSGALPYAQASESDKALNGFITDAYGMQNNDPDTFGSNLIW
jgi:hypothetical protein